MASDLTWLGILLIVILLLALVALIIYLFVFWIMMIVDCAKRKFKTDGEKVVWMLVVIFLQILGAIIYYFAEKRPAEKLTKKKRR